jgi:hypothetical protein
MRSFPCALLLAACAAPPPPPADEVVAADGAIVARLAHAPYDPEQHATTCKPWHQLLAPDGRQLTKDLGGAYEHHRGVFVGWNRVRRGGETFDFWHCRNGESQRVRRLERQPGPGSGQVLHVDWCRAGGDVVLQEVRRVTARALPDAHALVVASELRAAGGAVELGGDPHHAGWQFRAAAMFAEPGAAPVRFVRPADSRPLGDDVWADCRWIAAVLPFPDGEATVLRVEHPGNPPARWSTRAYGRFGAMWSATATRERSLHVEVAWIAAAHARDAAWCEAMAQQAFAP